MIYKALEWYYVHPKKINKDICPEDTVKDIEKAKTDINKEISE